MEEAFIHLVQQHRHLLGEDHPQALAVLGAKP